MKILRIDDKFIIFESLRNKSIRIPRTIIDGIRCDAYICDVDLYFNNSTEYLEWSDLKGDII